MQMMTWQTARLGSRFSLLFEPYQQQVRHSALGRFLDEPIDLMVGVMDPDGTPRTLPFTREPGTATLDNCEQFDRFNSITFRAASAKLGVRFEFNVHSVFYPQDESLCLMPAYYLEMRVHPLKSFRWRQLPDPGPTEVELFLRLRRPNTEITASGQQLDLTYRNSLVPHDEVSHPTLNAPGTFGEEPVEVQERIVSMNPDTEIVETGDGLRLKLPITKAGSGTKWRLVWGAYVGEPVLEVKTPDGDKPAKFNYTLRYSSIDDVLDDAVKSRDQRLALSRRFEKALEQAPLDPAQRHLINQSWPSYLSNTWWCWTEGSRDPTDPEPKPTAEPWFSVWEGSCYFHSTIDVEYNISVLYLTLWPKLLKMQLDQWVLHENRHEPSEGSYLSHDMGVGPRATGQAYPHAMEVEENCNYLLMMDAYCHWTGDRRPALSYAHLIKRLSRFLLWTDRDQSGFPSEGVANTIDDASPATQFSRKQTYLAVKRLAALRAAAGLLALTDDAGHAPFAKRCEAEIVQALPKIEEAAWLGDHYAVCVDRSAVGVVDPWAEKPLAAESLEGWDAYSIYTGNGLLLPMLTGEPPLLDPDRLRADLYAAERENRGRYGDGHSSHEPDNVWVSQNLWRDMLARYLKLGGPSAAGRYWDLQLMSNTHTQSLGFIDTYVNNYLCHYPRGIASIAYFLALPRLLIDRLAPGASGQSISIDPDRGTPQRWPLLPLADWKAGKIPVAVVDTQGRVSIEAQTDPVLVLGEQAAAAEADLIG